jgi:nucleotide-binding universal stress UspA family protein
MFHSILVPLDGSTFSEHALPLALTIAQRAGATVELVHVSGPADQTYLPNVLSEDSDDISAAVHAQLYLNRLAATISATWHVPLKTTILDGQVVPALTHLVETSSTDLLVMTTHSRNALVRMVLGSVADALVRSLSLPILLMRPLQTQPDLTQPVPDLQQVLIPLDGSALAESILEPAIALGSLFGAKYTILQAMNVPLLGYALSAQTPEIDQQVLNTWRLEAQSYLQQITHRLCQRNLPTEPAITLNNPPNGILEYAKLHPISMVALTTHGRSDLTRLLLGSTADAIIRDSHLPVLVCRPPAPIAVVE